MNIGILGAGGIALDRHVPALHAHPDLTLWSVLSRDAARAAAVARGHGAAAPQPAHTDVRTLLADPELDAVLIATPDRMHKAHAVAAARAGKHILLEKPMATSVEECRAIEAACQEAGVTLAMAYHMRHHMGHRALKARIENGDFGTLRHMRIHWTFAAPDGENWRAKPDTGRWWSLAANGTHCLDQIRWLMGPHCGEITNIACIQSHAKFDSSHDESSAVILSLESGATAEFFVSVQVASPSRVELYADDGWARAEDTMGRHGSGRIDTHAGPIAYTPANPFLGEWTDFHNAVTKNRSPEVTAAEGSTNVHWLSRIQEASL
ncbi:MAG: hypothetical protein COV99_01550 [Bacteroidetes bacterium CG12_big_fil_rev_8_21_14_0_65_60_17]|nr:MAG: hypothetical protein COV99_01550 [Bacteroidetes bacterium CG12_big_fil_rev_8_21_14_0_65_60_17]